MKSEHVPTRAAHKPPMLARRPENGATVCICGNVKARHQGEGKACLDPSCDCQQFTAEESRPSV